MEPYLEKAVRTGRLIVPSKLGVVPEEAYGMQLSELSLAGNMLKSLDPRMGNVRLCCFRPVTVARLEPRKPPQWSSSQLVSDSALGNVSLCLSS
eukprot:COSAG01_NODE_14773_length_1412_cov_1.445545_1_plen_94_part_00